MSALFEPTPCLSFCSVLYHQKYHKIPGLLQWFQEYMGPFLLSQEACLRPEEFMPMKRYYEREMGEATELRRFFILSLKLQKRDALRSFKTLAVKKEKLETQGGRTINIDPGIITPENVQLATGKNFTHRVYLGEGVFSDLTLIFCGHTYLPLEWTYPDYKHPRLISFFNWARAYLNCQLSE